MLDAMQSQEVPTSMNGDLALPRGLRARSTTPRIRVGCHTTGKAALAGLFRRRRRSSCLSPVRGPPSTRAAPRDFLWRRCETTGLTLKESTSRNTRSLPLPTSPRACSGGVADRASRPQLRRHDVHRGPRAHGSGRRDQGAGRPYRRRRACFLLSSPRTTMPSRRTSTLGLLEAWAADLARRGFFRRTDVDATFLPVGGAVREA